MKKEKRIADWQRLWNSANDPDEIAKARRDSEKKKRIEEKKSDTGYE